MADLAPDEVMARHHETVSNIFCADCNDYYPCDAYLMARRAKTAEDYFHSTLDLLEAEQDRVTALEVERDEAIVKAADYEGYKQGWEGQARRIEALEAVVRGLADSARFGGYTFGSLVFRAVELMEGEVNHDNGVGCPNCPHIPGEGE